MNLRTQCILAGIGLLRNHTAGESGHFIGLLTHGDAFFQIHKADLTVSFSNQRHGIRIPLSQFLAGLDLVAVFNQQMRTIWNAMTFEFLTNVVGNHCFGMTVDNNLITVRIGYSNRRFQFQDTAELGFNVCLFSRT